MRILLLLLWCSFISLNLFSKNSTKQPTDDLSHLYDNIYYENFEWMCDKINIESQKFLLQTATPDDKYENLLDSCTSIISPDLDNALKWLLASQKLQTNWDIAFKIELKKRELIKGINRSNYQERVNHYLQFCMSIFSKYRAGDKLLEIESRIKLIAAEYEKKLISPKPRITSITIIIICLIAVIFLIILTKKVFSQKTKVIKKGTIPLIILISLLHLDLQAQNKNAYKTKGNYYNLFTSICDEMNIETQRFLLETAPNAANRAKFSNLLNNCEGIDDSRPNTLKILLLGKGLNENWRIAKKCEAKKRELRKNIKDEASFRSNLESFNWFCRNTIPRDENDTNLKSRLDKIMNQGIEQYMNIKVSSAFAPSVGAPSTRTPKTSMKKKIRMKQTTKPKNIEVPRKNQTPQQTIIFKSTKTRA